MEFEAYLTSKRIDSARFSSAEPELWQSWKLEFDQVHPNSFTVQKLNLINPIRRKYQLTVIEVPKIIPPPKPAVAPVVKTTPAPAETEKPAATQAKVVPKIPRPGIPKPIVKPASAESARPASDAQSPSTAKDTQGSDAPAGQPLSVNDESSPARGVRENTSIQANVDKLVLSHEQNTPIVDQPISGSGHPVVKADSGDVKSDDSVKNETVQPASGNIALSPKPAKPVIPRPVIKPKPKPN